MVQIKIVHLIGSFIALIVLLGAAFMVGAKWHAPEAQTAAAGESFEKVEGEFATSSDKGGEGAGEPGEELFEVVKVVDGDTITISMNGKNETIRLIGIDTPETSDPRTGVQCFGKEATEKLKSVIGKRVSIEKDAGEGERDKYDRLLAYVYSEEGTMLNKYLIAQGYAYEYTYDDPYKYQKEFKAAEAAAKAAKRGLWAPDACPEPEVKGNTTTKKTEPAVAPPPASTTTQQLQETLPPTPQQEEPEAKKQPEPEPKHEQTPASSGSYTCSTNTYNCPDFSTHAEAQAVYEMCGGADNDIHKLDSNKDGEACESLP